MDRPFFIAGPCLIEGEEMLDAVAARLSAIGSSLDLRIILKGSFRKANRTSITSTTSIGDLTALRILADCGARHGLPTLTDIHTTDDASLAAPFVDYLQIPAFLSRQTDLILAAAATGKGLNIKKAQFSAPEDMIHVVEKARIGGAREIFLCERGTSFGYHDLVVDMRGLIIMRDAGVPVVYDATHSVQRPSVGKESGGDRALAIPLARAAAAVGIDGIFFETHPDPDNAASDRATQLPIDDAAAMIRSVLAIDEARRRAESASADQPTTQAPTQ